MSTQHHPCLVATSLLCVSLLVAAADARAEDSSKPYRIADGKVDATTYRGWRAYHMTCHACHGVDGVGTSVAPNLVERVKDLTARDFTTKVITSYRIVLGAGEVTGDDNTAIRERFAEEVMRRESGELVMPAWEQSEKVRPHVLDLYAYLRARADGALGPGEPQRLNARPRPVKPASGDTGN